MSNPEKQPALRNFLELLVEKGDNVPVCRVVMRVLAALQQDHQSLMPELKVECRCCL